MDTCFTPALHRLYTCFTPASTFTRDGCPNPFFLGSNKTWKAADHLEDYAFIDLTKVQIDHVISILLLALASSEANGSRREA
jgi:hypothetical protein